MRLLHGVEKSTKYLLRSKSFDFATNYNKKPSEIHSFVWKGHPFYYRTGTSDTDVIDTILIKPQHRSEYFIKDNNVKTILDIGGNIGTASVFFANLYPDANIYTFEPMPNNFKLLEKNVAGYPKVNPYNVALGNKSYQTSIYHSPEEDCKGSFSLLTPNKSGCHTDIQVKSVAEFIAENEIDNIDIIKIDTEGAEYDILAAIPPQILSKTKWIIGELHNYKNWELLNLLEKDFHIGVDKGVDCSLAIFTAHIKS
ncbi:FkbM family methyltransferase [Sporomusaceae bacterium BoRhaA]|uniref:FkbM family methyltransferase n=1 Tax=Pelorhabdus rhamnosifermentans TaxID=2772457 RepID=UPI001C060C85|nr:FkbM family methyltransferase [Pelorhabdus rhamnosifermentans]MBU2702291.1 FkbM family methyltransferase [Pelorhabdus rhamnosifermentans]